MKNYLIRQIYSSIFYPGIFVAFLWMVFLIQNLYDLNLYKWGVLARELRGVPGIVTSVLVHGDLTHIASNSIPLIVLGMMLFYFYKKIAGPVFIWIWLVSGIWLWIGGRNNAHYPVYHIGASTIIYGLASFLFFSGVFRRHLRLMVVSTLVVFLYGSIMWGIFPFKPEISWEGHLFGALAGMLVAFNYRSEGPVRKKYEWEDEEDEEQETVFPETELSEEQTLQVRYIYKPTEGNPEKENSE